MSARVFPHLRLCGCSVDLVSGCSLHLVGKVARRSPKFTAFYLANEPKENLSFSLVYISIPEVTLMVPA